MMIIYKSTKSGMGLMVLWISLCHIYVLVSDFKTNRKAGVDDQVCSM